MMPRRIYTACRLIVTGLIVVHSLPSSSEYIPFYFQTGGASTSQHQYGDTSATGLFYSAPERTLYMTGDTYGSLSFQRLTGPWNSSQSSSSKGASDCFLGVLQLPKDKQHALPQWKHGFQFGVTGTSDSCMAVEAASKSGNIYVAGTSFKSAGLLTSQAVTSSTTSTEKNSDEPKNSVSGLILDFDVNHKLGFQGGLLMQEHHIQYPIATDHDPDSDSLFVASSVTEEGPRVVKKHKERRIGRGGGGGGAKRFVEIKKLSRSSASFGTKNIQTTLRVDWQQQVSVDDEDYDLIATSLAYHRPLGALFLGGSTTGEGPAIGQRSPATTTAPKSNNMIVRRVWNGFVTKLDAGTGNIQGAVRISALPHPGQDDRVWGICAPSSPLDKDDTQVSHVIYAVGVTTGTMHHSPKEDINTQSVATTNAKSAFLVKVNTDSMTVVWTRQLRAKKTEMGSAEADNNRHILADVTATSCAVSPDGEVVYMAGTTSADAFLDVGANPNANVAKAAGGKDVFVAQYAARDGQLKFARQIGSAHNDWLSYGRTIVTDELGNAMLMGNTQGPLFRLTTLNVTDMFVVSLHKDTGDYKTMRSASAVKFSNDLLFNNSSFFMSVPGFIGLTMLAAVAAIACYLPAVRQLRRRAPCFQKGGKCARKKI